MRGDLHFCGSPKLAPFETLEECEAAISQLQQLYLAKYAAKGLTITAAQVRHTTTRALLPIFPLPAAHTS
jgi:hypothetical protein